MKRKILIGCVMLILGLNTISVKADIKEHRTTWDCIWFGTYPQTEITDRSSITSKTTYLRDSGGCVIGYNVKYYNKGGEEVFCKEAHMDEMKYFNRLPDNNKGYDWKTWNGEHYFRYEPIKWRILKMDGDKVLLLSDKIIDQHNVYPPTDTDIGVYYRGERMDLIWSNSILRTYMNNTMYEMAFSEDEQEAVLDSEVTSGYTYKEGKDTTVDKLFILSYHELVNDYGFTTQNSLLCGLSDYGKASGTINYASYGTFGSYFTLSDGYKSDHIQYGEDSKDAWCKAYSDAIDNTGKLIKEDALYYNGIRVAMWVDLSKVSYQYAGTVSSAGEVNEVKFKYPIKLSKIKIKSVKNVKKKTVSIKFQKVKDARKYKIQYATNKRFKKAKVRVCKKTSYQIKKLKKGKVYYVRVRALNGKKQGKWSKVSKIKIRR